MFDKELLKNLDNYAYNRPDVIPSDITRNDKAIYRVYFRFMCLIYKLYRHSILDGEELRQIKEQFISDLSVYNILYRSALSFSRRSRYLDNALTACNKNKDNCPACMGIYTAQTGYVPEENESDIEV